MSNACLLSIRAFLILALTMGSPVRAQEKTEDEASTRGQRSGARDSSRRQSERRDRPARSRRGGGARPHADRNGHRDRAGQRDLPRADDRRSRNRGDRRERWRGFDDEKQRGIRELYRGLEDLPRDKREKLLKRLRAMSTEQRRDAARRAKSDSQRSPVDRDATRVRDDMLRRVWRDLPPEKRRELESMAPEKRQEHVRRMYRERRKRAMASLPGALREQLAGLSEREQASRLRHYLAEKRAGEVFEKTELDRIRSLPQRDLFRLLRPFAIRGPSREGGPADRVPRDGGGGRSRRGGDVKLSGRSRPEFISEGSWKRWMELPRFERSRLVKFFHGEAGGVEIRPRRRSPRPGARRGPPPHGPRRGSVGGGESGAGSDRDTRPPRRGGGDTGDRRGGSPAKSKGRQRRKDGS